MKDTIYRQDAIDALTEEFKRTPTMAIRAKYVIEQLPSTQLIAIASPDTIQDAIEPERKTGTWQRKYSRPGVYADLCWHCSICGGKFSDTYANMWKYCPDCGAKMEGEQ